LPSAADVSGRIPTLRGLDTPNEEPRKSSPGKPRASPILKSGDLVRHPFSVAEAVPKAIRIIVGLMLMAAFVLIIFGLMVRYAGGWGVPFFSYTSERGSKCTNTMTGYTCEPLTLADVEFYTDLDLPADTRVMSGRYAATHDYSLNASLRMTPRSQAAGFAALRREFGECQPNHPPPISTNGLSQFCVLSNDIAVNRAGEPPGRIYVVGTGVAKNGIRVVSLAVRSR
jgi:hypothetical protein